MSIFHRAIDRLADFIWIGRKVNLRFTAEYRTACYAVPLINKLLAESEDGDAYRTALVPWHEAERPPIASYQGDTSSCRIDGPWQMTGRDWLPLGGLILSPGITAHLNPFEAQALHDKMRQAIEGVILAWVRDHDLHALPPVPEHFDRRRADQKAKAMIAAWASGENATAAAITAPGETDDCCSDEATDAPCDACGKGGNMADTATQKAMLRGCDATHRASNSDTHLTHGCIQLFRQFSRVRQGCATLADRRGRAMVPFFEGAARTPEEAVA